MRTHRTSALIALTLVSALALGACSGAAGGNDNKSINILLIDQPTTKEMQADWIPEFEKSSGIKVNVETVPESGMDAKFATALSSGSAQYDVVMAGAKNWNSLVSSDWIAPLDDKINDATQTESGYLDGFPKQLMTNLKINDKQYAMPFQVGGDMLFYNKKMFSAAGLDPNEPPRTMEGIVAAAKKLKAADPSAAAFVGRGTRNGNENSFLWIMMWFLNGGRWVDDAGKDKFDVLSEPAAVTTAEQYKTLMTEYAPKGASSYGFAEAQLAMQQGKAAMWLDAAQLGPALEDKTASTISGDVGYAALQGAGDDFATGAVWGLSMVSGSQHQDEAWKLIQYLTGKQVSVGQAVSGANGSPARSDVLADPSVAKALSPDFLKALNETIPHANPNYSPLIPQGAEIRGAISLELSNMLAGSSTVEQAMTNANSKIQEITAGK